MANDVQIFFSVQIKTLRLLRGLSQDEFAKLTGIHPDLIPLWEDCKIEPTIPQLEAIANAFDITIDFLLREPKVYS